MSEPTPYSVLRVEFNPTNPPKPVGLAAFKDGKPLAYLTIEDVRRAVADYDAMLAAWLKR